VTLILSTARRPDNPSPADCYLQNLVPFSVEKMKPFTLRVLSTIVLPKRLSLVQRFTPSLSASTPNGRGITVTRPRSPRWTCDEYIHTRVHRIRYLSSIAPIFSLGNDDPTMSHLTPPQPPPTWTHTPEQVTSLINDLIAKDRAIWDKIGSLPSEDCNFDSVRLFQSARSDCSSVLVFD
jgi:hypothetical protein